MALSPSVYAELLCQKVERHQVNVWLVNTGWTGGQYGIGQRMRIAHTRAMVHAALDGSLAKVPSTPDPVFGVLVPKSCPDVPPEVLDPRSTWNDKTAYDRQAHMLAAMFRENFKQFEADVKPKDIREAEPRTSRTL
jgi:phosphoenolpyruvate carboxykinase (ATP)